MGIVFLKHSYCFSKYLSVLFITFGLILCTFEDYRTKHLLDYDSFWIENTTLTTTDNSSFENMTFGIIFLTFSLLFSAGVGIYQEYMSKKFGKYPDHMLFFVVSFV